VHAFALHVKLVQSYSRVPHQKVMFHSIASKSDSDDPLVELS
jgi:hypothetical protein